MKIIYPISLVAVPLIIIFMAFFNPSYAPLVNRSIPIFVFFALPYCFLTRDPRKGLLIFLAEASLLEGPWKAFSYGSNLKLLVYMIRDLLLYTTFLNFLINKTRILSKDILNEKIPYVRLIALFIFYVFIQVLNPLGYNIINSIAASRIFWEMIPLYWLGYYLMREKKNFLLFFWASIICVLFNAIVTILQFNWGAEKVAQIAQGYYVIIYIWGRTLHEGVIRPFGLGSDMGFAGALFCLAVSMFISLFFIIRIRVVRNYKKYILFIILFIFSFIGIAGLLFSTSRTEMVLSVITVLVYIYIMRRKLNKIFVKTIITLLLIYLLIPYIFSKVDLAVKRYESIKNPARLLKTIFEDERGRLFQAFMLPMQYARIYFFSNGLGKVGPGAYIVVKPDPVPESYTNSENTLNLSLTEIGTIGVFLWLLFHFKVVKSGLRVIKHVKDEEWQLYLVAVIAILIVLLLQWPFGQLIVFPVNAAFWFVAGIAMGSKYIE